MLDNKNSDKNETWSNCSSILNEIDIAVGKQSRPPIVLSPCNNLELLDYFLNHTLIHLLKIAKQLHGILYFWLIVFPLRQPATINQKMETFSYVVWLTFSLAIVVKCKFHLFKETPSQKRLFTFFNIFSSKRTKYLSICLSSIYLSIHIYIDLIALESRTLIYFVL